MSLLFHYCVISGSFAVADISPGWPRGNEQLIIRGRHVWTGTQIPREASRKIVQFSSSGRIESFFYFFLWKPPCCLGCQVDCNCMFFFSERPRCLSSQPGEVVQWRRHRRRFSLCLQGYSEKDDSGHKKKQTRVLWHETHTHTHSLSQAVLKGDYGVLLCSSWPQLAGWAMAVNSILRGNFNRLSTSKWNIIFFKCLTTLQRGSLQRQNLFVFTKKKKKNPNCFFLPARST